MRKILLGLVVSLLTTHSSAQFESQGTKLYESEGQLISLRLIPGDKTAKLYLVGKKTAELSMQKNPKLVSVMSSFRGKNEELAFTNEGDAYVISPFPSNPSVLKIKAEIGEKQETIKLKVTKP